MIFGTLSPTDNLSPYSKNRIQSTTPQCPKLVIQLFPPNSKERKVRLSGKYYVEFSATHTAPHDKSFRLFICLLATVRAFPLHTVARIRLPRVTAFVVLNYTTLSPLGACAWYGSKQFQTKNASIQTHDSENNALPSSRRRRHRQVSNE